MRERAWSSLPGYPDPVPGFRVRPHVSPCSGLRPARACAKAPPPNSCARSPHCPRSRRGSASNQRRCRRSHRYPPSPGPTNHRRLCRRSHRYPPSHGSTSSLRPCTRNPPCPRSRGPVSSRRFRRSPREHPSHDHLSFLQQLNRAPTGHPCSPPNAPYPASRQFAPLSQTTLYSRSQLLVRRRDKSGRALRCRAALSMVHTTTMCWETWMHSVQRPGPRREPVHGLASTTVPQSRRWKMKMGKRLPLV